MIGSILGIAGATAALVVTLVTTTQQVLQASSIGLKTSLSTILLRDGTSISLRLTIELTKSRIKVACFSCMSESFRPDLARLGHMTDISLSFVLIEDILGIVENVRMLS